MIDRHSLGDLARAILLALPLAMLARPAAATITIYNAQLSGANENPANASAGTGLAIITVDDVLDTHDLLARTDRPPADLFPALIA